MFTHRLIVKVILKLTIITRSQSNVESHHQKDTWKTLLASATKNLSELLKTLELSPNQFDSLSSSPTTETNFPLFVPDPFINKMRKNDIHDPLLLQVLPTHNENMSVTNYTVDPLNEKNSNITQGIIHKYYGRVLLIVSGSCAINCRYCFRRHFPYSENRVGQKQWQEVIQYIQDDNTISEVILSGGEPLLLDDEHLEKLITLLEAIPHVIRLRIHTRLPVVIPQRITTQLLSIFAASRFNVCIVLHINHPNEIDPLFHSYMKKIQNISGITLLNQSVLLKGINDDETTLIKLSNTLFNVGILPYYLHLLDKVEGAAHFEISTQRAIELHKSLQCALPGYLVPKLVYEEALQKHKTLLYSI
jgi:EF-P beta-lysylation protein EpmB